MAKIGEAIGGRFRDTAAAIEKIRARGGKIVFVRFPHSGGLKELEDRDTPKQKVYFTQRATFVEDFEKWGELFRAVFVNRR